MTRHELMKYQDLSVRVDYSTKMGPQSRTGFVGAITTLILVLWPFESTTDDNEMHIPIGDVNNVKVIKGGP